MSKDHRKESMEKDVSVTANAAKFYEQIVKELKTEERFVNYFKQFRESDVENFIKFYASSKVGWFNNGPSRKQWRIRKSKQWMEIAEYALDHIQYYKYIQLQNRWQNGELVLDGIEVSMDFIERKMDILDCEWLKPVTQRDIDEYLDFFDRVWDEQGDIVDDTLQIVGHKRMPNEDRCERSVYHLRNCYAEWEQFKNRIEGRSNDRCYKKHDREAFYVKLAEKEEEEIKLKRGESKPASIPIDTRPGLYSIRFNQEIYEEFIQQVGDKEQLPNFRALKRYSKENAFTESIEMDLIYLNEAKKMIAISSHDDWRDGIQEASQTYGKGMIREAIIVVWERYENAINEGKKYERVSGNLRISKGYFNDEWKKKYREKIKRGKVLNGEEPKLDL